LDLRKYRLVFKNIGLYTILNLFNSIIPFLLLPILTKHLSKEEFGLIDMFNNLGYIFIPFVGLNIGSSVIRFYYDKDKIDLSVFISSILYFLIFSGILLIGATVLLSYIDSGIFEKNSLPFDLILLSIGYALFSQIGEILLSLWRAEEDPAKFGIFRVSKSLIDLGVSAYLIVYLNMGWAARVNTAVIVSGIFSIIAIYLMFKSYKLRFKVNYTYIKSALAYSSPLILHTAGSYIISFSDRFVILHFLTLKEVGLYGVAYQIGMIMSFINNSFNQAWTPFMFSKLNEGNRSVFLKLHKINLYYFVLMLLMAVGVYLFVPFIYKYFIGKSFLVSPMVVFWVLLGYALNGMYKMIVNYMFYYKQTTRLSLITVLAAIVNVVLCWILVPIYGILGAAVATTLAFLLMFLLVYIQYHKLFMKLKNMEN